MFKVHVFVHTATFCARRRCLTSVAALPGRRFLDAICSMVTR